MPWPACPLNWLISLSPPVALSGKIGGITKLASLDHLKPKELRALAAQLIQRVETLEALQFAKRGEQLSPDQGSLLNDLIDTDIAGIEAELESLKPAPIEPKVRQQPKRAPLSPAVSADADPPPTRQQPLPVRLCP